MVVETFMDHMERETKAQEWSSDKISGKAIYDNLKCNLT